MKALKYLAVAGIVFTGLLASAQEKNKVDTQWPKKQTEQIKTNIKGVTKDQESKILAIEEEFTRTVQAEMDKSDADSYSVQSKLPELRKERDAKLQAVFTPEQFTQYQQIFAYPQKQE